MKITIYIPFGDLGIGDFVLVRLANPKLYPMWMERAEREVVKDEQFDNFKHVHIQWWVPIKKRKEIIHHCIKIVG